MGGGSLGAPKHEVTVVLCCAYADLASLQKLERSLHGERMHVHLVPGIDRDLEAAALHLLNEDERTVFAVANSSSLDVAQLDQLLSLFGERRAPLHRLCVAEFEDEEPEAFLEAVRDAVHSMRSRSRAVSAASSTSMRVSKEVAAGVRQSQPPASVPVRSVPLAAPLPSPSRTRARLDREPSLDPMCQTAPGLNETGDTFPDLSSSVAKLMEGRASRLKAEGRRRALRRLAVGAGVVVLCAGVCTYWLVSQTVAPRGAPAVSDSNSALKAPPPSQP